MIKIKLQENTFFPEKLICGIDEAGRGPLAGPLIFTGIIFDYSKIDFNDNQFKLITDSKKLSFKQREKLFHYIKNISLFTICVLCTNDEIDNKGLSFCINKSLKKIILSSENFIKDKYNKDIIFIFDGKFNPFNYNNFYTFIKADYLIKEVSAASIVSKVIRDRIMISYSKIFKNYHFDKHKGYGTKSHRELIKKYGLSPIHRKSFKINSLNSLFD